MMVNIHLNDKTLSVSVDHDDDFDSAEVSLKELADALRPLLFPEPRVVPLANIDLKAQETSEAFEQWKAELNRICAAAPARLDERPQWAYPGTFTVDQVEQIKQTEREAIIKRLRAGVPVIQDTVLANQIEAIIRNP